MRIWFVRSLVLGLLALAGCVTTPAESPPAFQDGPVCDFGSVEFSGDFEGGRLSACRKEADGSYALYFRPEDTPINPSSWYAFAIDREAPGELEVSLNYIHGRHRYAPKYSTDDGATWNALEAAPAADGESVTIRPPAEAGRTLIAGQPLFNLDRYQSWMDQLEGQPGVVRRKIGRSEAGRDIEAISFGADGAPVLVLLGRQHPPEIPGAFALQAFVNRLLEDDPLATRFRRAFRVEMIPVLNPDGVALGQWRHNTRGIDLNRDWGPFTQAETRAARDWMAGLGELAIALDFHGTWVDTIYTQLDDAPGVRAGFPRDLSEALIRHLGDRAPKRDAAHNPGSPTAKTWIHTTYEIPALTYEVGDGTPLSEINETARIAAEVTMHLLLEEPA